MLSIHPLTNDIHVTTVDQELQHQRIAAATRGLAEILAEFLDPSADIHEGTISQERSR